MLKANFSPFPQIGTQRLLLRRMTNADANQILHLRSNEKVMKYVDRDMTTSIADAENFIGRIDSSIDTNNGIMWAITLKEDAATLIGNIGYWRLIKEDYRAEIGYMLEPAFWNKGVMKEALTRLIDFGFQSMDLHSIEARINPHNAASAALLESTGFVKEAYFKEHYFFNGVFKDTVVYSRLDT